MRVFLVLLFLASATFACEGTISQYVPAVMGSNGGLINVSASLVPGQGDVYVSVVPTVAPSTQQSIENAVNYAYLISDEKQNCDVLFRFEETTGYIEGPSGGAAMAVMTYALLEDKEMRTDTVITGTVDRFGNIGPVGGVYEKAKSAAAMGADYFIMPRSTFYEVLLLRNIEEEGIEIIEAEKAEDVIGFMLDNKSIEEQPLDARKREIPELSPYDSSKLDEFIPVARRMIMFEEQTVASIMPEDNDTMKIKEFFENEVQRQDSILAQGYVFSAANEAFLNYIDVSTIAVIAKGKADLPRKKGEVGICLTGIERPVLTDRNFEWVVGSDLRQAWAYDRFNSIEIDDVLLTDEKFIAYHELMYGQAWCNVANSLISAAPQGGAAVNESVWKELADAKISEAKYLGVTAADTESRLEIAEQSYADGRYGAAIFDAVFVIEMEQAERELVEGNVTEELVDALLEDNYTTLWGNVYHSHAAFLQKMNETGAAYSTIMYARGLESATLEMGALMEPGEQITDEKDTVMLAALAISLFLLIIVIILIRRAYGNQRKGHRKTYGTQQKKGRA